MAAPVAAGTAVMLLQANPTLTPNLVKSILMYTAQPLQGFNTFEQGAGEINVAGAFKLAQLVRADLGSSKPVGGNLLTNALPTPQTTISDTVYLVTGNNQGQRMAKGSSLMTKYPMSMPRCPCQRRRTGQRCVYCLATA